MPSRAIRSPRVRPIACVGTKTHFARVGYAAQRRFHLIDEGVHVYLDLLTRTVTLHRPVSVSEIGPPRRFLAWWGSQYFEDEPLGTATATSAWTAANTEPAARAKH